MRRRLFTLLSALSLLLCVGTCVLWPLSLTDFRNLYFGRVFHRWFSVEADKGRLYLSLYRLDPKPISEGSDGVEHDLSVFGYGSNQTFQRIMFPFWILVPAMTVLPAAWVIPRLRVGKKDLRGLCPACGYDLRATPDRCPECGTVPTTPK